MTNLYFSESPRAADVKNGQVQGQKLFPAEKFHKNCYLLAQNIYVLNNYECIDHVSLTYVLLSSVV